MARWIDLTLAQQPQPVALLPELQRSSVLTWVVT
jgi:hypothetical protein